MPAIATTFKSNDAALRTRELVMLLLGTLSTRGVNDEARPGAAHRLREKRLSVVPERVPLEAIESQLATCYLAHLWIYNVSLSAAFR